jgi:hypothetical protein
MTILQPKLQAISILQPKLQAITNLQPKLQAISILQPKLQAITILPQLKRAHLHVAIISSRGQNDTPIQCFFFFVL